MMIDRIARIVALTLVFITWTIPLSAQSAETYISYLTGREKATRFNLVSLNTGEIQQIDLGVEPIDSYDWSPDGQKIALDDGQDVYIVNAGGSGLQQVTHSTEMVHYSAPAWSPNGTKIALIEWSEGGARLALINEDGSGFQHLMGQPDSVRGALVWSPDERFIAANSVATAALESLVVDVQACLQTPDNCLDSSIMLNGYVSDWSLDGRRVMLSGGKFSSSLSIDEVGLKLATPQCRQQPLTPCAVGIALSVNTHWPANAVNTVYPYDSDGHWSADGQRILFTSNRTGSGEIYLIDADGSHLQQLTHETDAYAPRWRPV